MPMEPVFLLLKLVSTAAVVCNPSRTANKSLLELCDKLCLLHPCPIPAPLACLLFDSLMQVSLTCSPAQSLSDSDIRLSSQHQVLPCTYSSVPCKTVLRHPMQDGDINAKERNLSETNLL